MNETPTAWWNSVKFSRGTVLVAPVAITFALLACTPKKPKPECFPAVETQGYVALHGFESISVSKNFTVVNHDVNTSVFVNPEALQELVNSPDRGLVIPGNIAFIVHLIPDKTPGIKDYTNVAYRLTILRERMRELEKQNRKLPTQNHVDMLISIPDTARKADAEFTEQQRVKDDCTFSLFLGRYLSALIFQHSFILISGKRTASQEQLNNVAKFVNTNSPIKIVIKNEAVTSLLK